MKHRSFIYTGGGVPDLDLKEYPAFFMNVQRAVLMSLEKKKLLTSLQRERCMEILENQYGQKSVVRGDSGGIR